MFPEDLTEVKIFRKVFWGATSFETPCRSNMML